MMNSVDINCLALCECENFEVTSVLLNLIRIVLKDNSRFQIRYVIMDNGCGIWVELCSIEKDVKTNVVADHVL